MTDAAAELVNVIMFFIPGITTSTLNLKFVSLKIRPLDRKQ